MRCFIFGGIDPVATIDIYNKCMKDRTLTKDVIIHSHMTAPSADGQQSLIILVFFDEDLHPEWVGKA